MSNRFALLLCLSIVAFTSCVTTERMRSIKLEMMKPGLFTFVDDVDTIAVFKRDLYQPENDSFIYVDVENNKLRSDNSIRYHNLSNKCLDVFADYLANQGYFLKVINFRDSLNHLFSVKDSMINHKWPDRFGVDACIYLDYFQLNDRLMNNSFYFDSHVLDNFPEFRTSTIMETVKTNLVWTISFQGDTSHYMCKQHEDLHYGNSVNPELFGNNQRHRLLLENVAVYMGETFASKLIPSWQTVDRTYYRSNNAQMLLAERFLVEGRYMEAAEIYKPLTTSKNPNIVAKATFNMALISEMDGKLDAATDWLDRSDWAYKHENPAHQFNCKQYGDLLTKRIMELEVLDKQVRNDENNAEN